MIKIKLAGIVAEVDNRYPYLEDLCRDYIVQESEKADIKIRISNEELIAERESSEEDDYPDDYLEGLAVYRRIAEAMPDYGGFLMHGAVIKYKDKGIIFSAPSGTGKTTHVMYWKETFGDDCVIVNGDKPLLRQEAGVWYAYGTPWCGKENLGTNTRVRLTDSLMITRGSTTKVIPMRRGDAVMGVLTSVYRPKKNRESYRKTLDLIDDFIQSVRVRALYCALSPDAAKLALAGLNE